MANSSKGFQPFVSDDTSMAEFTGKAIFLGVLFGLIFGASTVYLGLRAGLTVSASIPIAVLAILLSLPLFLYSYGYGAISSFSAVYADVIGVSPKTIYLTTLALVTLVTRPFLGRLGDQVGYKKVFLPCLVMMTLGLAVEAGRVKQGDRCALMGIGSGLSCAMMEVVW